MRKFLEDGPLWLRIPAYFTIGTLITAVVLSVVVAIIAIAISLGWWGWLFVLAVIGGLVATCASLSIIEQEKIEKEKQAKRQQRA